jgi:hypothetical protein
MDSEIPAPPPRAPLPPSYPQPRRSRTVLLLLFALTFIGGIAVAIWAAPKVRIWFGPAEWTTPEQLNTADNASAPLPASPQSVSQLEARLAAVSSRLDGITREADEAGGNAGRAEALLIAFAARRALDRGAPLGYLEGELRLRFADAQPRAVATIINAAAAPVTIPDLQSRLEELAPALVGGENKTDLWTAAKRELSSLIIVRKAGAPSLPQDPEGAIAKVEPAGNASAPAESSQASASFAQRLEPARLAAMARAHVGLEQQYVASVFVRAASPPIWPAPNR